MKAPRDETESAIHNAVLDCFRGTVNKSNFDTNSRLITLQGQSWTDTTETEVPVLFPYGFASMPPAETEVVYQETAAGLIAVSTRSALPSAWPAPADGDACMGSSGGSYSHHDADGDLVLESNSGKFILVGKNATVFAAKAPTVDSNFSAIKSIVAQLNNHLHLVGTILDSFGLPCTGATAGAAIDSFNPSSTAAVKAKVE